MAYEVTSLRPREGGSHRLVPQTLRAVPTQADFAANAKPVPLEAPSWLNASYLKEEYEETRAFVHRQLRQDPRLKPKDVEVALDHMGWPKWIENANYVKRCTIFGT